MQMPLTNQSWLWPFQPIWELHKIKSNIDLEGKAGKEILESLKVLIKVLTKVLTILLKNTLG